MGGVCSCDEYDQSRKGLAAPRQDRGKVPEVTREGVPQPILHLAESVHVDPYVAWMWTLTPDFLLLGEPKNREGPADYYLLHVMREYCKDPMQQDMDEFAVEIMGDRKRIVLAKMKTYGPSQRELLKFMGDRKNLWSVNSWLLVAFSQCLVSILMTRMRSPGHHSFSFLVASTG